MQRMMAIIIAASASLGVAAQTDDATNASLSFSRLVEEVAQQFQRGDEPANCEKIKEFIVRLTDDGNRYWDAQTVGPGIKRDALKDAFFKTVRDFIKYLDSHRLRPSDVIAIREWMAESLDVRTEPRHALAIRAFLPMHLISHDMPRAEGNPEPRHILLLSVIAQPLTSVSSIGDAAASHVQGKNEVEHSWKGTKAFLFAPENKELWDAIVITSQALIASQRNGDRNLAADRCEELVDELKMLDKDSGAFNKAVDDFIETFETRCIAVHPDFALPERYLDILSLRDAWVVVRTSENDLAKKNILELIARLRMRYEKRSDRVTVKWLNQVIAE